MPIHSRFVENCQAPPSHILCSSPHKENVESSLIFFVNVESRVMMEVSGVGPSRPYRQILVIGVAVGTTVPVQKTPATGVAGRQHSLEELFPDQALPSGLVGPRPHNATAVAGLQHTFLVIQELGQEVYVLHGQSEDLVLGELLVWRVGGDELAEVSEGTIHILLAPALTTVGEYPPHDFGL